MEESLEELQELFDEMFQEDLHSFGIDSQAAPSCSPSYVSYSESSNSNNKRVSADMSLGKTKVDDSSFNSHFEKFCLGVEQQQPFKKVKVGVRGGIQGGASGRRRRDKKQRVSSGYDVSSHDYGISAS
ncbi:dnaJ [Populus alba x Populus x berolinensis]|nr:dnaJ [Populus alba x Populus x berolinensis]